MIQRTASATLLLAVLVQAVAFAEETPVPETPAEEAPKTRRVVEPRAHARGYRIPLSGLRSPKGAIF
jgi:hypothetical protein